MVMLASEAKAASAIKAAMDFQTTHAAELAAITKALDGAINSGRFEAETLVAKEKAKALVQYMLSQGYEAVEVRISGATQVAKLQFRWK